MKFKQGHAVGSSKNGAARGAARPSSFVPIPPSFQKVEFDPELIRQRLEVSSYLHKGVKLVFEDEAQKDRVVFQREGSPTT